MPTPTPTPKPSHYVVMTASAHMPNKVKHPYRRVAVLQVETGTVPKMISRRARGVIQIVQTWERRHVGSGGPRTAYGRALDEAHWLADRLNARPDDAATP